MNEVNNLEAHYSTSSKVKRSKRITVVAPDNIPTTHLFNHVDADKKMKAINNDIYAGTKQAKSSSVKNFVKWFCGFVLLVLGIIGIKKLFRKS